MSEVTDEVEQLFPSTTAVNWGVVCTYSSLNLASLFFVIPGLVPGAGWSHFMRAVSF
jgi:hypothetical protein